MEICDINRMIKEQVCFETINKLEDSQMLKDYKNTRSVKNKIKELECILKNNKVSKNKRKHIIEDYTLNLVPSGTKGVLKGNKFNYLVKKEIQKLDIDIKRFDIKFEEQIDTNPVSEIPDWYIFDRYNSKIIIGMNQLDLWKGGHQSNRGYNYLNPSRQSKNIKLLCVICNDIKFKNKTKISKLFEIGFSNDILCYITNIETIINRFFNLRV